EAVLVLLPDLAVLVEQHLRFAGARYERRVVAVPRGELDRVAVGARKPERRVRTLHGLVEELHVAVLEELPLEVEQRRIAGGEEDLERLAIALARFLDRLQVEDQGLDR